MDWVRDYMDGEDVEVSRQVTGEVGGVAVIWKFACSLPLYLLKLHCIFSYCISSTKMHFLIHASI